MKLQTSRSQLPTAKVKSALVVLSLAVLACNLLTMAISTPTPMPLPQQTIPPASSPTPVVPTIAARTQNATPVSIVGREIDYGGIRFVLHPAVSRGVNARVIPETLASQDVPLWAVSPEYTEFILDGYPVQADREAEINVFAVEAFTALVPDVAQSVESLKILLANEPPAPEEIPIPQIRGAAQVFRARVHYLPFHNGTGVGFITQYAQDITAIFNGAAFYTFQGLTDDGAYYVSAILPITAPFFGARYDDFDGYIVDYSAANMADQYRAYLDGMTVQINEATPEAFTPSLGALDETLQSLQVK